MTSNPTRATRATTPRSVARRLTETTQPADLVHDQVARIGDSADICLSIKLAESGRIDLQVARQWVGPRRRIVTNQDVEAWHPTVQDDVAGPQGAQHIHR